MTQDEPQIEPVPSISSASGSERASGRVKRQVSEMESEAIERRRFRRS